MNLLLTATSICEAAHRGLQNPIRTGSGSAGTPAGCPRPARSKGCTFPLGRVHSKLSTVSGRAHSGSVVLRSLRKGSEGEKTGHDFTLQFLLAPDSGFHGRKELAGLVFGETLASVSSLCPWPLSPASAAGPAHQVMPMMSTGTTAALEERSALNFVDRFK